MKINNPIAGANFGTIEDRQKYLKGSLKDFFCIGTFLTAFFIAADFVPLYTKWNSVQEENVFFVIMLSLVSAAVLDLPMYIAGRALREYLDGLRTKKSMSTIFIPSVVAFFLVYIPFVIFSFVTKDATFEQALPLDSSMVSFGMSNTATASNPQSVSIAAIFCAIIPLGTSIASLLTGIYTYNPAKEQLKKLERVKLLAQEHRTRLAEGIAQVTDRMKLLEAREQDLFENYKDEVYAQEQIRIQAYEEALEEALDADGILRVTDNAFDYLEASGFNDVCRPLTAEVLNDPVVKDSKGMTTLKSAANAFGSVA